MQPLTRDYNALVGTHDVVFITLDTLRYDVAVRCLAAGRTPNLGSHVEAWEQRHTPGSFTLAAHHAFFAGFLPTPVGPHPHPRPFAAQFEGSVSITEHTAVFQTPDIVAGFASHGYRTICVGGTGFFNKRNGLGHVLPSYFQESHWSEELGVTHPRSTDAQVAIALERVEAAAGRVFLFINVSALHQPNCHYLDGHDTDSVETMEAALAYVDGALGALFARMPGPTHYIVCSDHGTAYGEDGLWGHRLAHPTVWTVPYAEFTIP